MNRPLLAARAIVGALLVYLTPALGFAACLATAASPADSTADSSADSFATQSVDALVTQGRELLASGKAADAQKIFEQAAAQDEHKLRTQQWVIRSWLPQGRINDALNAADELANAGNKGPAMDYLFGMAFAAKAQQYVAQQVNGQIIEMSFADAVGYLESATKADPVLYRDAFAPLAEAAWYMQKLDVARTAADKAVELAPQDADAAMIRGKIALSQYVATKDVEGQASAADAHWDAARTSFEKATERFSARGDQPARTASAALQWGHTFAWKQKKAEAAKPYAIAVAADPGAVDFGQVLSALEAREFVACLEDAAKTRKERSAGETSSDATLLWWLGWARFENKQYKEADEALQQAVRLNPTYTNSWFYMAHARYAQKDFGGAAAAFRRHFEEDPADLAKSIAEDTETNLAILDYLVGWCASNQRTLEAGILSEAQTIVAPTVSRYWNNAGLFYRDTAERQMRSDAPGDPKSTKDLLDKAYTAYSTALELSPEDPSLLNDTAVMLHYYLKRDLERARAMYVKAHEIAEAALAKGELSEDDVPIYKIALRDSKNNLVKLDQETGGK